MFKAYFNTTPKASCRMHSAGQAVLIITILGAPVRGPFARPGSGLYRFRFRFICSGRVCLLVLRLSRVYTLAPGLRPYEFHRRSTGPIVFFSDFGLVWTCYLIYRGDAVQRSPEPTPALGD
jgi:hypothetical protein